MIAFERRASTVLFNLLRSHEPEGPFLLPSNICPIVPLTFFKAGRSFEFIDIAPDTLCMDPRRVRERCGAAHLPAPAGVIYVRTYGAIFDCDAVFSEIRGALPHALIVDDRCLCEPDFSAELPLDVDVALYSTGYAKFVDIGFGGVGVLREGVPYERTVLDFEAADLSFATDTYKRALATRTPFLYADSNWLETSAPDCSWPEFRSRVEHERIRAKEHKREINRVYASGLPRAIQFSHEFQDWRFNIHVRDKPTALKAISAAGLFASGHYDSLDGVFGVAECHQSHLVHKHVINLFNDRYFSVQRAEDLVGVLTRLDLLQPSELFE